MHCAIPKLRCAYRKYENCAMIGDFCSDDMLKMLYNCASKSDASGVDDGSL